jgi:hypothetical protein
MKLSRLFVPVFLLIAVAVAIGARLAENPKKQELNRNSMGQAQNVEQDRQDRIRSTLSDLLRPLGVAVGQTPPLADAEAYKQIQVQWQSSGASGAKLERQQAAGAITLLNSRRREGVLPRERFLELSTNQILIAALDQKGQLIWWRLILDPRLVRSETPGPGGVISADGYYLTKIDFIVQYPDDSGIKELRFYHPLWNGKEFSLELLSTLPVE